MDEISESLNISKVRSLGTISAFDLNEIKNGYGSEDSEVIKKRFLQYGLLIRPLGNTIYLMPPYCITPGEFNKLL